MLRCQQFSHAACGRSTLYHVHRVGYTSGGCWGAWENIAWGSGSYATVRSRMSAWPHSDDHRPAILSSSYRELGLGLRVGTLNGRSGARVWTAHSDTAAERVAMTLLLVVGGWLLATVLLGGFAVSLGRAAALGDRAELARSQAAGAGLALADRRRGLEDRRGDTVDRPWASQAPGRRSEDALRRELIEARQAVSDAEARLADHEARSSEGAEAET